MFNKGILTVQRKGGRDFRKLWDLKLTEVFNILTI